jgi:hypothetical protein
MVPEASLADLQPSQLLGEELTSQYLPGTGTVSPDSCCAVGVERSINNA